MKKTKKPHGPLARAAGVLLGEELPVSFPGEYYLELVGGSCEARALISGTDRLTLCTDEEVAVLKKGKYLRILGKNLHCLTYSGGVLEIKGDICTVLIENGRRA